MKRLLTYLKPHKWIMTAATTLVLFIIVVELYRPIIIGDARNMLANCFISWALCSLILSIFKKVFIFSMFIISTPLYLS